MSFGFAVDTAERSCAKRRTDWSRLLDPAAIGKTAVALEVAEELNLILKPKVRFVHPDKL
jgi:hypothetical protein